MKTNELPIQFKIIGIKTDEFAILEESFDEENIKFHYALETKLSIPETRVIVCSIGFKFFQDNIPFLKVRASCFFEVKKESWENAIDKAKNNIFFAADFTDHLVILTLGALRGILHAKTEGTKFNCYFIPTTNITELRDDDTFFSVSLSDIPEKKSLYHL